MFVYFCLLSRNRPGTSRTLTLYSLSASWLISLLVPIDLYVTVKKVLLVELASLIPIRGHLTSFHILSQKVISLKSIVCHVR